MFTLHPGSPAFLFTWPRCRMRTRPCNLEDTPSQTISMTAREPAQRQTSRAAHPSIARPGFFRFLVAGLGGVFIDSTLLRALLGDQALLADSTDGANSKNHRRKFYATVSRSRWK